MSSWQDIRKGLKELREDVREANTDLALFAHQGLVTDEEVEKAIKTDSLVQLRDSIVEFKKANPEIALKRYLESKAWLPDFVVDFHDMKNVFKCIEDAVVKNRISLGDKEHSNGNINWCDALAYTTDIFLWFMAEHGFTLQPSDTGLEHFSIEETLKEWHKRNSEKYLNK